MQRGDDGGLIEALKKRHDFDKWRGVKRTDENLLVRNFFLAGHELSGWRAGQVRRPEVPGWPPATRSNWTRPDSEGVLVIVETFECPDLVGAHEVLMRALAEFQSPDLTRSEVGDMGFVLPGETAALYARANLVVLVRNGGRKVIEVTEQARAVDAWISVRPEKGGPVVPEVLRLEPGVAELEVGGVLQLDIQAADPLGREVWLKFYSRLGEISLEGDTAVYRASASGTDAVTVFALNENGAAASQTIELSIR